MRIDVVLGLKIKGHAIMFEDMSSAFDKLTYSGIQDGLWVAGATRKTRAMVRACQKGASTVVRQQNPDGRKEHSGRLLFDAGILQGGMHSPHIFITVLGVGLALADPIEPDMDAEIRLAWAAWISRHVGSSTFCKIRQKGQRAECGTLPGRRR